MKRYSVKAILFNVLVGLAVIAAVSIGFCYAGYPLHILTESLRSEYSMLSEGYIYFICGVETVAIYVYSIIGIFGLFCISVWIEDYVAEKRMKGNKE